MLTVTSYPCKKICCEHFSTMDSLGLSLNPYEANTHESEYGVAKRISSSSAIFYWHSHRMHAYIRRFKKASNLNMQVTMLGFWAITQAFLRRRHNLYRHTHKASQVRPCWARSVRAYRHQYLQETIKKGWSLLDIRDVKYRNIKYNLNHVAAAEHSNT